MTKLASFKLLHLSDLHAGMGSQHLLWPNLKAAFFNDLGVLHKAAGPWDLVLFSGDFAQKGLDDEFDEVIRRLEDIWRHFETLGFQPRLVCVPGNHDIKRPDAMAANIKVLKRWFDERDIWDGFFENPHDEYRVAALDSLAGYSNFMERLSATSIPMEQVSNGILPGDQITRVNAGGVTLGLVTFNSTWLQLTGDDYKGRLAVDLRQAYRLQPELGRWSDANDFNVVVTHHPADWLHPENRENTWNGEISPAGRFDLHLFGHMHEPFSDSHGVSGSALRHVLQAPSLFGMEFPQGRSGQRIHGYSLLSFDRLEEQRSIRVWPRILRRHTGGQDRFIPDTSYLLVDDRHFGIDLRQRTVIHEPPEVASDVPTLQADSAEQQGRDVLRPLRYHLPYSVAHRHVRDAEQGQCREALEVEHALWIAAEWGLGSQEFLGAVTEHTVDRLEVYRLDASEYSDMDSFSKEIGRKLGTNFARFCDALGKEPSLLILDDFQTTAETAPGARPIIEDVEALVELIRDACPSVRVIIRTMQKPMGNRLACVQLKPLSEADVKLYVANHDRGDTSLTTIDAISILYRHTDGYPMRLDERLKELSVVTIEELSSDGLVSSGDRGQSDAPPMLKRAVAELASATEKTTKRMYDLLRALHVFPQGAELARIKRFNGVHAFYPPDAVGLMERGLITVSESPDMEGADGTHVQKVLVVPRPIRDYLRSQMKDEDLEQLNTRAANLLFGSEWMAGSKDWPAELDYSSSGCGNADISNAGALLIRLFLNYRDNPESRESISIVSLAASFAGALCDGAHYTSAANFCRDFMPLMGPHNAADKRADLIRHYASAMRMLGDKARAKELLSEIADYPFPKMTRQSVLIELALCYQSSDPHKAVEFAKDVIKLDRQTSRAHHAQSIIVDVEYTGAARTKKLIEMEKGARRKEYVTVANNIALLLASEAETAQEASALVANVLKRPTETSIYNRGRAVLEMADRKMADGLGLSDGEVTQLISCYHFLLNERVPWMFNNCHKVLWYVFKERGSWENLLVLFRFSSMIWRLRGEEYRELDYLGDLQAALRGLPPSLVRQNKSAHYYFARFALHNTPVAITGTTGNVA